MYRNRYTNFANTFGQTRQTSPLIQENVYFTKLPHNTLFPSYYSSRDSRQSSSSYRDRESRDRRDRSPLRNSSSSSSSHRKWESSGRGSNGGSSSNNSSSRDKETTSTSQVSSEPRVRSVGEWTEHISSSGKRYYYNSVTEVSRKLHPFSHLLQWQAS